MSAADKIEARLDALTRGHMADVHVLAGEVRGVADAVSNKAIVLPLRVAGTCLRAAGRLVKDTTLSPAPKLALYDAISALSRAVLDAAYAGLDAQQARWPAGVRHPSFL